MKTLLAPWSAARLLFAPKVVVRYLKMLARRRIETINQLMCWSAADLLKTGNFGQGTLRLVRQALADHRLALKGDNWKDWRTTVDIRDSFTDAIEADHHDVASKLAFADWLIDQGEEELAEAFRWCGEHDRHPHCLANDVWGWDPACEGSASSIPEGAHDLLRPTDPGGWTMLNAFKRLGRALLAMRAAETEA